jgi:MYXO-CTERM domain-containing protein
VRRAEGGVSLRVLLGVNALVDALLGCVLLFFPEELVDALGLPASDPAIYANLAGAMLLGVAVGLAGASRAPEGQPALADAVLVADGLGAVVLIVWVTVLDSGATAVGTAVLSVAAAALAALAALLALRRRRDGR